MKFEIQESSTIGGLKTLCTTLSTSALHCEHSHQGCLLFNGNRLNDDMEIRRTEIEDGDKLILFLRHNCSNCNACSNPYVEACPTDRHVAVIIAEDITAGQWDIRVVGDKLEVNHGDNDHSSSEETQPWQRVRKALTTIHGHHHPQCKLQDEHGRPDIRWEKVPSSPASPTAPMKIERWHLEQELSHLKAQKKKTEEVQQNKMQILLSTESEIIAREQELLRVERELQETRQAMEEAKHQVDQELEELKQVRSRAASYSIPCPAYAMDGEQEDEDSIPLSRSAPAQLESHELLTAESTQAASEDFVEAESQSTDCVLDLLSNQVEALQRKMDDEVRRTSYCSVCFAKPFVWVFKCGHAKCDDCAVELRRRSCACPECRQPLEDPRRLFWSASG